jgi:hypothetical protein
MTRDTNDQRTHDDLPDEGSPPSPAADARRLLRLYLRDHTAAAVAGRRLVRRARRDWTDPQSMSELCGLRDEIDADDVSLRQLLARFDWTPDHVKGIAAAAAETIGRLKLNARLVRTSPLGLVYDLEVLIGGVHAKRMLWRSLAVAAGGGTRLGTIDVQRLADRADDQLRRLEELHGRAARAAFVGA